MMFVSGEWLSSTMPGYPWLAMEDTPGPSLWEAASSDNQKVMLLPASPMPALGHS